MADTSTPMYSFWSRVVGSSIARVSLTSFSDMSRFSLSVLMARTTSRQYRFAVCAHHVEKRSCCVLCFAFGTHILSPRARWWHLVCVRSSNYLFGKHVGTNVCKMSFIGLQVAFSMQKAIHEVLALPLPEQAYGWSLRACFPSSRQWLRKGRRWAPSSAL